MSDRLAAFAHELAGLLDATRRYVGLAHASLARSGAKGAPVPSFERDALRQLEIATQALDRMTGIVKGALSPAAPFAIAFSEPRPLIDAVTHACEALKPLAFDREVRLELDYSPRLVLAEAGPIYTVLTNVIRNAIEATPSGGLVQVVAELVTPKTGGPHVRFDVLDTGAGPPKGNRDVAFGVGFTTKAEGSGLGLPLCREILRELKGWVELKSRAAEGSSAPSGAHLVICYPLER